MTMIAENLDRVRARIQSACQRAGRSVHEVQLLAVSKTFGVAAVMEALAAGQQSFGENYIQEAVDKMALLQAGAGTLSEMAGVVHRQAQWHCIGPVQSNKTRLVATHFQWVHTIDRLKIAQRLSEQRPHDAPPLQVCIQVNVQAGAAKAGVPPEQALPLALAVGQLPGLCLRGVMSIPDPAPDEAGQRRVFAQVRAVYEHLQSQGLSLDTLSMGMSGDLEAAVLEGSTMVRVGSAIFGRRTQAAPTHA